MIFSRLYVAETGSHTRSKKPLCMFSNKHFLCLFRPLVLHHDHPCSLLHLWENCWEQMGGVFRSSSSRVYRGVSSWHFHSCACLTVALNRIALFALFHSDALDALGLKRYCCRRMLLAHVDLIEKLLNYAPLEKWGAFCSAEDENPTWDIFKDLILMKEIQTWASTQTSDHICRSLWWWLFICILFICILLNKDWNVFVVQFITFQTEPVFN